MKKVLNQKEMDALLYGYEKELIKKRVEHCIVLDKFGDFVVTKQGTKDEIYIRDISDLIFRQRVYTHNHIAVGVSFSLDDIMVLETHELIEMRACDKLYWYSVKRTRNSKKLTKQKFLKEYDKQIKILHPKYQKRFDNGEDEEMLIRELLSETMKRTLSTYGFIYRRNKW